MYNNMDINILIVYIKTRACFYIDKQIKRGESLLFF